MRLEDGGNSMNKYMVKWKSILLSALCILPIAIIGGITTGLYMLQHSDPELIETAKAQLGSLEALVAVATMQSVVYALVAWIVGYFLVDRLGLLKSFKFEITVLKKVVPAILILGVLFASDYFTFGSMISEVAQDYEKGISLAYFIASLTYGGVIEEVLMRWFFMSLIAFILVMIFARKKEKTDIPAWIFITANVASAFVFAIGHLPATQMFFGEINALILFRCFLLNGGFGLFFGRWYRKYGIQYAMLGHFGLHLVSKLILLCVL